MKSFIFPKAVRVVALISATVGFGNIAVAQTVIISPKSQSRSVQIAVTFSDVPKSTSAQAGGYGVFNKTLNYAGGAASNTYQVRAVQNSQIGPAAITAAGSIINRLGHPFAADGNAQSDFKVTFLVTQDVTYSLSGFLLWDEYFPDPTSLSPSVKLTGPLGVVFDAGETTSDATQLDFSGSGALPPGEYVLEAHAAAFIPFPGAYADKSFNLALVLAPIDPQPRLTDLQFLNAANFCFTLLSPSNRTYRIERSFDLTGWSAVGLVTTATPITPVSAPLAVGEARQFFRAVQQ